MKKQELTQELLKNLLFYNPDTGVFVWRERPLSMYAKESVCRSWNIRFAGKEAGGILNLKSGYKCRTVQILWKRCLCHHLAYLYMTGSWPKQDIDCIDGDFTNLKYNNIRACTRTDTRNKTTKAKGKTKLIGSYPHNGGYKAEIKIDGKSVYFGTFNTPEEAHTAYCEAKRQISTEFSML